MTTPTDVQPLLVAAETIRYQAQFTPRLLLTHLKTTVTITDRRVIVRHPHVVFGVIEHGFHQSEVPLRHVSQVATGNATNTRNLTWGAFAVLAALVLFGVAGVFGAMAGVLLLVAAVVLFATASSNGVFFRNTGGGVLVARGSRAELPLIRQAGAEIGAIIFT